MPANPQAISDLARQANAGSPLGLAAVRAGAPTRQNPQGSALYQQAYGMSFAQADPGFDLATGLPTHLGQKPADPTMGVGTTHTDLFGQTYNITAGGVHTYQPGSYGSMTQAQIDAANAAKAAAPTADTGGTGTNFMAYTPSGDYPTMASPTALEYLGLPNYANMGSNFTGGTNASNPFAGLFGFNDQTNFLSNWT